MSRLFWKLFALSALWTALIWGWIGGGIALSDAHGLGVALLAGVVLGSLSAGTLVWMHRRGLRSRGFDPERDGLGVAAAREVRLNVPPERALALCEQAVRQLAKTRVEAVEPATGLLRARAGSSWDSWGERITCQATPAEGGGSRVRVASRPALRVTLVDYGKNRENVARIGAFLEAHGAPAPEPRPKRLGA